MNLLFISGSPITTLVPLFIQVGLWPLQVTSDARSLTRVPLLGDLFGLHSRTLTFRSPKDSCSLWVRCTRQALYSKGNPGVTCGLQVNVCEERDEREGSYSGSREPAQKARARFVIKATVAALGNLRQEDHSFGAT